MKPGRVEWATSANFWAGPDVGSPTKAPPTAAQISNGYYTDLKVAPQIWNYERWALAQKAQHASSIRVLNWIATTGVVAAAGAVRSDAVYDPTTLTHVWTSCTAAGLTGEYNSRGGLVYTAGVPAALAAGALPRIATDGAGAFVQCTGLPATIPRYCAGVGLGWAGPPAWVLAGSWGPVAHDQNTTWVMGDVATGNIALTTGPLAPMVASAVQPGFTAPAAALLQDIVWSNHPAGTVYPNDPGNQVFMALNQLVGVVTDEISTSTDGNTWIAATAPFLAMSKKNRLAYSAYGTRWGVVDLSYGVEYSDDNGLTWSLVGFPPTALVGGCTMADIACDGFGDWAAAITDGTNVEVYVSYDNATTWLPAILVSAPSVVNICLWYGLGRFHLVVDDGAGVAVSFASLAAGDDM